MFRYTYIYVDSCFQTIKLSLVPQQETIKISAYACKCRPEVHYIIENCNFLIHWCVDTYLFFVCIYFTVDIFSSLLIGTNSSFFHRFDSLSELQVKISAWYLIPA